MQLHVTGHHVEVTPALRGYVEKKLERIGRHFDQVIDVHCVLTVEKLRQKAEATLHVSGNAIHADATEEDMYAAIDLLADKLDRCIKKRSEEHTSELQSRSDLVCRLLLEKKKKMTNTRTGLPANSIQTGEEVATRERSPDRAHRQVPY